MCISIKSKRFNAFGLWFANLHNIPNQHFNLFDMGLLPLTVFPSGYYRKNR